MYLLSCILLGVVRILAECLMLKTFEALCWCSRLASAAVGFRIPVLGNIISTALVCARARNDNQDSTRPCYVPWISPLCHDSGY